MLLPLGILLVVVAGHCLGTYVHHSPNCTIPPKECPNENITFYLYRREMGEGWFQVSEANTAEAPLTTADRLVLLVHGYTGHKDYSPNMELRPVLLGEGYVVLTVDWSPLAREHCYYHAAKNTDLVGLCTARLLASLFDQGKASRPSTRVIGFSLGSHVVGVVGRNLISWGKPLPWITGLDPALPMFDHLTSRPSKRLDRSDAAFVDIVHTNAFVKGKLLPMGHVDFYMNGASMQPGCHDNASCSHVRAVEYYAESFTSEKGFWGTRCVVSTVAYVVGFKADLCSPDPMGKPILMSPAISHQERGTYQILTRSSSPYAVGRLGSENAIF